MKIIPIILLVLLKMSTLCHGANVGDNAPDFRTITLKGNNISYVSQLKDKKPVYLVFWATWCPNCKRELPHVEKLFEKFGDKISFIAVNVAINESLSSVEKYVATMNLTLPVVYDEDKKIMKAYGVVGTPTTIILSRDGKIKYRDVNTPDDVMGYLDKLR